MAWALRLVLDFLRSDDLPPHARVNFVRERLHYLLWSLVVGAVEGNLAGIVVTKTFGASQTLTTIVWSAPIVMMMLNVFWGVVIRGRRRLRLYMAVVLAACGLILSMAFASPEWHPWGGWLFAFQVAAAHFFVTGLVTLRSSMWKVNYPHRQRGQIVGRLQQIRFLFVPVSGIVVARIFDLDPQYYRYVYPAAAALGLISLLPLRRFDVREQDLLETNDLAPRRGLLAGLREAAGILAHDAAFRRYMIAQFTLGSANFFTDPVLLDVLARRLELGYLSANLLMAVIPGLCSWMAIRLWSPYFDRVGVLRFRVVNCVVWIAAYAFVTAAMVLVGAAPSGLLWLAIGILVIGRVLKGVAHGGGVIAWSIGHLHFADSSQMDLYMSIHVALTGLRALAMPFMGLLANRALGNASFAVAIGLSLAALLMFRKLARVRPTPAGAEGDEIQPPAANVS